MKSILAQVVSAVSPAEVSIESYTLSPEKHQQAVALARAEYTLYFVGAAGVALILLVALGARLGPRLRDFAERRTRRRFYQAWIFGLPFLGLFSLAALPVAVLGQVLSRRYAQSIQSWPSWFGDWIKSMGIEIAVGVFAIWLLYGIIRRSPRFWWLYAWLVSLPLLLFFLLIEPVVVEPLFFDFVPLDERQPALAAELQRVVSRGGLAIPRDRMFIMEASEKLNSVNAYVTGLSASKRVVVWDTTIAKMTTPEILCVFGHEMGHYVLHHILIGTVLACFGMLVALFIGHHAIHWLLSRRGSQWQIRGPDDWASLPALLLIFAILVFVSSPIGNGVSRHLEHRADQYAIEVTRGLVADSRQTMARALQKLGEIDLEDPSPGAFITFWLYDHPPLNERIAMALHGH